MFIFEFTNISNNFKFIKFPGDVFSILISSKGWYLLSSYQTGYWLVPDNRKMAGFRWSGAPLTSTL